MVPVRHEHRLGGCAPWVQSRRFGDARATSAFPLIADVRQKGRQVRKMPGPDVTEETLKRRPTAADFPSYGDGASGGRPHNPGVGRSAAFDRETTKRPSIDDI
jgi:hypothetical protein